MDETEYLGVLLVDYLEKGYTLLKAYCADIPSRENKDSACKSVGVAAI